MSVDVKGAEELKEKLQKLLREYPKVVIKAIYKEANVILKESQKLCPVDTGRLRASAYVSNPTTEEGEQFVRVGYGASYALAVHERTEVRHEGEGPGKQVSHRGGGIGPLTAEEAAHGQGIGGTGAKFLSRPVDAHRNSFASDVANRIKADPEIEEWKKGGL